MHIYSLFEPYIQNLPTPKLPKVLTPTQREVISTESKFWANDSKYAKNTWYIPRLSSLQLPFRLERSIIKIEDQVYILHSVKIGKGSFGTVKWLEDIATGEFLVVKICDSYESYNEIKTLLDLGLIRGSGVRVKVTDDIPILVHKKIYIVIPYFGPNFYSFLKVIDPIKPLINDKLLTALGVTFSATYGDLHNGVNTISGEGYAQLDLKPENACMGPEGFKIVDYGTSRRDAKHKSVMSTATEPYIPAIISNPRGNTEYPGYYRSGEFFDLITVFRIADKSLLSVPNNTYRSSYFFGIFPVEYIRKFGLSKYLVSGFNPERSEYIEEDDLLVKNCWQLAAVIIASVQLHNNQLSMQRILTDENLALTILGEYCSNFSNWSQDEDKILKQIFELSYDDLITRANLVKFGLRYELNKALECPLLLKALNSTIEHNIKRATVRLFKCNLLTIANYEFLINNKHLAIKCIEAHTFGDISLLKEILSNKRQEPTEFLKYPLTRHLVRDIPFNSAVFEDGDIIVRVKSMLRGFTLSSKALATLTAEYKTGNLQRLINSLKTFRRSELCVEALYAWEIADARTIYNYLTNYEFNLAINTIIELCVPQQIIDSIIHLLTSKYGLFIAEVFLILEENVSTHRLIHIFNNNYVRLAAKIFAYNDNELRIKDFATIFEKLRLPVRILTAIDEIKGQITSYELKQLLFLAENHPDLYSTLLDNFEKHKVRTFMLDGKSKNTYIYESGNYLAKLKFIDDTLHLELFNKRKLRQGLNNESVLRAGVILQTSGQLRSKNIELLLTVPKLTEIITQRFKINEDSFVELHKLLKLANIAKELQIDLLDLEMQNEKTILLLLNTANLTDKKLNKPLIGKKIISLFYYLDILSSIYTKNYLGKNSKFEEITSYIQSNFTKNIMEDFKSKMNLLLNKIDAFVNDKNNIRTLQRIQIRAARSFQDMLLMSQKTENATKYLHELRKLSNELREDFETKPQRRSTSNTNCQQAIY